ncbi:MULTISPECIES: hypothetical protein [Agrobacterium]|uniref:hypothetical protein n=1 Tax=Agrobacterium TaxID=357 RepID=UPI000DD4A155|nr:hypothetical protein [Agrobacterium tumefaciens]MCW8058884.1 hypothetical protein [Agrobacterium tumefaciens]MCW8146497.1 hypothetical protein [Agrobacterium tumefaciens]MQB37306.1 hypothetical protein [Agrobacterium tumefaciens]NTA50166.1 hypothetical protein [Agrobacterium tumefaciens]NTE67909.1 hypothetical protein [Agrobacterium tumefaciens]
MIDEYGPYAQVSTLGEQMAACYQTDANLVLEPHLAHYMDEVEVNIAADSFNHVGFLNRIRSRLQITLTATTNPRRREFLQAVVAALQERIDRHSFDVAQ